MEGFDDHHGATATQWTGLQGDARERLVSISVIPGGGFESDRGREHLQELPAQNKISQPDSDWRGSRNSEYAGIREEGREAGTGG